MISKNKGVVLFLCICLFGLSLMPQNATAAIKTIEPVADSYIDSTYPDKNQFSDATWLDLERDGWETRIYLKFDLSDIPSGADISSATLRLYVISILQQLKVGAYYCPDNSWEEQTITWNNAPGVTGRAVDITTIPEDGNGKYHEWNALDIVTKENVVTIVLMIVESEFASATLSFFSREGVDQGYDGPELEIEYTSAGIGVCLGTFLVTWILIVVVISYVYSKNRNKAP